jgi:acyl carrier protein
MQKSEVGQKVKEVVATVLKRDASEITDDANFIFDLGADSAQSVELIAALEAQFSFEMDAEKALSLQTVSEAVEYIADAAK